MKIVFVLIAIFAVATNCSRQPERPLVEGNETIIDPIEPQPQFPGGLDGLKEFLKANYKWTQGLDTVEGTVFVGFTVNEDGTISDPKIVRGLCETCDKEAIRLIENMPKWEPAKQNGQALKKRMVLPINFAKENPYDPANNADQKH